MTVRRDMLKVGHICGLHGVSGWVKVYSYTDPPRNIFEYDPWIIEHDAVQQVMALLDAKPHGAGLVAKLAGIDNRDAAAALLDATIFIRREQLPAPAAGEYYWADLVGLEVVTGDGQKLGSVKRLFQTGANDVMVVSGDRERLIPWIVDDVIAEVDFESDRITVMWDPDF